MTDANKLADFLNSLDNEDSYFDPIAAAFFDGEVVGRLRDKNDYPREIKDTLYGLRSEDIKAKDVEEGDIFADTMGTFVSRTATGQAIVGKVTRVERGDGEVTLHFGSLTQTYLDGWHATSLTINAKPLFDGEPVVMVQLREGGRWDLAVRVSDSQYESGTRFYDKTDHVHKWARVVVDNDIAGAYDDFENSVREYVKY